MSVKMANVRELHLIPSCGSRLVTGEQTVGQTRDGLTDRQSYRLTDRETKKAMLIFASRNCIGKKRRRPEAFQCPTQNKEVCFTAETTFLLLRVQ